MPICPWSKNKCPENSLCYVHLDEEMEFPLKIDNGIIEIKSSIKFLGVTLDSKLTWRKHVNNQCKKAKRIVMQSCEICTATVRPSVSYAQ